MQQETNKHLKLGLNSRSSDNTTSSRNVRKIENVFGSDNDSEDDNENTTTATARGRRSFVNRELAAEQKALRKRAKKSMAEATSNGNSSVYNYDEAYDSFHPEKQQPQRRLDDKEPKRSRYIQDLLKASKNRQQEHDLIYERKVLREQQQEEQENESEFLGKEKFVTKAYKRKLEERQQYQQEEKTRQEKEDKEDITKQTGGVNKALFANFYGNLNRNVAMGAGGAAKTNSNNVEQAKETEKEGHMKGLDFTGGFERNSGEEKEAQNTVSDNIKAETAAITSTTQQTVARSKTTAKEEEQIKKVDPETHRFNIRKAREEKVAQARIRYFQRNEGKVTTRL